MDWLNHNRATVQMMKHEQWSLSTMESGKGREEEALKQSLDELLTNVTELTTSLHGLNTIFQKITEHLTHEIKERLEDEVLAILERNFDPVKDAHSYQEGLRLLRELGAIGFINRMVWRAESGECKDLPASPRLLIQLELLMAMHPHVFMNQAGGILSQFALPRPPSP